MEQIIICSLKHVIIPVRKITEAYGKRLLFCMFFLVFFELTFVNAAAYGGFDWDYFSEEPPLQDNLFSGYSESESLLRNNLPSENYCLENGLFAESYPNNSFISRALPEDLEEGENGLGLVPVGGKETYIFLSLAFLYSAFLVRKIF
ncbi:hypothetical protein LJC11_03605 [Bacteroidales bacterium OttesenSCG-928-I21]|nr:hypothetical protein [Bacteroidales bacterium OttesenSCG-928-I21]